MNLWSVECESNSWNDDLFVGTYDDCINYICTHNMFEGVRLALVEVVDGQVIDCLEIKEIDDIL